jgi:hypothetical protein
MEETVCDIILRLVILVVIAGSIGVVIVITFNIAEFILYTFKQIVKLSWKIKKKLLRLIQFKKS